MKKIYLAAVAGNLGMLTVGQYFGWTSPSLPILMQGKDETYHVRLTSEEASWVASLLMLGAMLGAISCSFIVNVIGRKNSMLFAAVPSIISWLMIAFATSSWELYISRFLAGLSTGITFSATAIYIGEISPADIRGNLGSMFTVVSKIGTTLEYVIGPFLSVRNLAFVSLAGPCLFLVTFIWLPESPYHLMRRNARQKAINSLVQLRGKNDVHKEADDIEQSIKVDLANDSGFRELLCVPGNRKALITLICLAAIHQMSGAQAVEQYAELIFNEANSNLEGLSPLPTALIGELFPTNVKALGSMVTVMSSGVFSFGVTKLYLVIADNIGIHVPFWIFTACSLAGALFTFIYVPETKGKTLEQIQEMLHGSSSVAKLETRKSRKKYFRVGFF